MSQFKVQFEGRIQPGQDEAQVRERIGKLFNCDAERLEVMFSGRPIPIKNNVDEATAAKYKMAIEKAGALCTLISLDSEEEDAPIPVPKVVEEVTAAPPPPAAAPKPAAGAATKAPAGKVSPYSAIHEKPADYNPGEAPQTVVTFDNLAARMAAADQLVAIDHPERIADELPPPTPPVVDLSGLSLAPEGTDLTESKPEAEVVDPDISGLKLE